MAYVAQQAPGHLDVDGLRAFVEEQLRNIARATAEAESIPVVRVALVTQQVIATGVTTKVNLDSVEFDSHVWWDAANKRYTPQRAGYYRFSWQVFGGASTTATRVLSSLGKNGALNGYGADYNITVAGVGVSAGSLILPMNGSTDYVELNVLIVAAAPIVGITGRADLVHFHGNWLRAL